MIILITGSISPQKVLKVSVKNSDERLFQYIESIKFWIVDTIADKIVFCENSYYNYDYKNLFELAEFYDKEFEVIQFYGNNNEIEIHGKGYGEGEIIEYALNHSNLLLTEDYFYKVTGRIKIININSILREKKNKQNKFILTSLKSRGERVDTRFYYVSKSFYDLNLKNAYHNTFDSKKNYIENVFFRVLKDKNIKSFHSYPRFLGYSGSTGKSYKLNIMKYYLKNIFIKFNLFSI
jgi:hypothetical protein